jgi:hypothetical protein
MPAAGPLSGTADIASGFATSPPAPDGTGSHAPMDAS